MLASARSPCGGGAGLVGIGSGRTRWHGGGHIAGRRPGSRARSPGTLGLGRPEIRGLLARTLVARARNGRQMVPDQGRARAPVYSFIYSGIICFVYFIYTEPESSIPATHNSAEEESAGELHAGQAKPRADKVRCRVGTEVSGIRFRSRSEYSSP